MSRGSVRIGLERNIGWYRGSGEIGGRHAGSRCARRHTSWGFKGLSFDCSSTLKSSIGLRQVSRCTRTLATVSSQTWAAGLMAENSVSSSPLRKI